MGNVYDDKEKYNEYTKSKENSLKERHIIKEETIYGGEDPYDKRIYDVNDFEEMPSEYGVKLEYYKCNDDTKRYWNIIKVTILKKEKPIFSFIRDYSSISMCYAHNNNMDYIVFTGENYQGFSIYNLTKETFYSYIPTTFGWCPSEIIYYNEDTQELKAYGCVWGGDFEWRYYKIPDLDNPTFNDYEYTIDD